MSSPSIFDLLTHAPKQGKGDKDSYNLFQETLASILRLSGSSKHPRMVKVQQKLGAVTTCLYAAYVDMPISDVCKITGQSPAMVRKTARELELPTTTKELCHGLQAILVSSIFNRDAGGLFRSFQALSSALEAGADRVKAELEKPDADLKEVTTLLERLTRLSLPYMYLYRDAMEPSLERKINKWMKKDWTRAAVQELTDLS